MRLYQHKNYQEYFDAQVAKNKAKLDRIWVEQEEIQLLSSYLLKKIPGLKNGLCHGVRNGAEINWFREFTDADVVGTDISPTASRFPHVIQWDFHDPREDWIGQFDFIYSNSFDHAYDPEMCLQTWMQCLSHRGLCIIQWTPACETSDFDAADCFAASLKEYRQLFQRYFLLQELQCSHLYAKRRMIVHGFVLCNSLKLL